jgi:hypothetical protein
MHPFSGRSPAPTLRSRCRRIAAALPARLLLLAVLLAACAKDDAAEPVAGAEGVSAQNVPVASAVPSDTGAAALAELAWTDRVWVRSDTDDMPGRMLIFLSNGTLVMDSCWEVYRLSAWESDGADGIVWSEDGQEIRAEVVETTEDTLRLRLQLVGGAQEESYRSAPIPYVCPEMAR